MKQQHLEWNKEFLKDEWNYCTRLINEKITELDSYSLENHNGLSEQHMFMTVVRNIMGKGQQYYLDGSLTKEQKQTMEHLFLSISNFIESLEKFGNG